MTSWSSLSSAPLFDKGCSHKALCFFRHRLTESPHESPPAQPHRKPNPHGTDSQKAHMHYCLFSHNPASIASQRVQCFFPAPAWTALLTESPHGNPPAQPHSKPNPERDRPTESRQHSLSKKPGTRQDSLQKAHMRTRQHSLTESPTQKGTDSQKAHTCVLTTPPAQPHKKPRHPPGQPYRKPT